MQNERHILQEAIQPEHITQASLFSIEHMSLASSSWRSFCLRRAAANSGSASAACLVFSSNDRSARLSSTEAFDSSGAVPSEVDDEACDGVATGAAGATGTVDAGVVPEATGRRGEDDDTGVVGVSCLATGLDLGAAAALACFFASLR